MGLKKPGRLRTSAPSPCLKCGRVFLRKDSLARHVKTHDSHLAQRPFHRITHQKFRACAYCRRTKVRCTGSIPCAKCEQLQQECHYDQKHEDQSASYTTSSSGPSPPATEQILSLVPSSPQSPPQEDGNLQPPVHVELVQASFVDSAKSPPNGVPLAISSPGNPTPILQHLSLSSDQDARSVVFNGGKDFFMIQPTHVSPTLHILDPYSYKLPSIPDSYDAPTPNSQTLANYRYPVLQYLSPFLKRNFESKLACSLLDTYFSSAFSSRMHPNCHHIHNFILRRCDVLDPTQPRNTHPALLASMLFVAALSDKALGLFSGPEEKERVCKYLSLLLYQLLNPSAYEPLLSQEDLGLPPLYDSDTGWTNDDLRKALGPQKLTDSFPMAWSTDYIMALIHVASVISGSEKKAASIRWYISLLLRIQSVL